MRFSMGGKIVLFSNMRGGDKTLFLYNSEVPKDYVFQTFIEGGIRNNEACLYAFPEDTFTPSLSPLLGEYIERGQLYAVVLPSAGEEERILGPVADKVKEIQPDVESGECTSIRLLADLCHIVSRKNIDQIIQQTEQIFESADNTTSVIAHNIDHADMGAMSALAAIHDKIVISTQNETTVSLPEFSSYKDLGVSEPHSLEMIPQEKVEGFVKKNLEVIVLSMLQEEPMCGYDLIKSIVNRFGVFLSQGTVYPLLYSLRERDIIEDQLKNDKRTKIYVPTFEGRVIIKKEVDEFVKVHEYLINSIHSGTLLKESAH